VSVVKHSERVIAQQWMKAKKINSNLVLLSLSQQPTRHCPPRGPKTKKRQARGAEEPPPTATPSNPLAIDPRFLPPFLWDSSDPLAVHCFSPSPPPHKADGLAPPPRKEPEERTDAAATVAPFLSPPADPPRIVEACGSGACFRLFLSSGCPSQLIMQVLLC
jgi:hypothetical protein